ncbi:hypothetical protein B9Z65_3897 [Elsinoe australis]|uniref:Uncharacterized protein n=1 Tax=Elsinoe australis TaxID=40998 RepID=A0A2P8A2Y6_9PEZI|nr:hypothetical protein B9Z65_3897 [Elsinoe australis]
MSGFHSQILHHIAKRGVAAIESNRDAYVKSMEHTAPRSHKDHWLSLVVFLTLTIFVMAYASIRYTLGEVIASLAMIEQPKTVVVSELRPVDEDKDDIDASLAKDRLLDEEVTIYTEKPVTTSIRQSVRHLVSIGGYGARWRGLQISVVYHFLQGILANLLSMVFSLVPFLGPFALVFGSLLSTVLLARIHMTWTHIMISRPSPLPWYRRIPSGRIYFKTLITPALIFAIAQHLTVVLPMMVYFWIGGADATKGYSGPNVDHKHESIRLIAMLATMAFVGIALLLPASVTLTRVEASLLPDDAETIVNFDRTLGGAAANLVGFGKINFRALYDAAWRSYDKASRIRLIKFYIKYFAIMTALVVTGTFVVAAEFIIFGASFASLNIFK